MIEASVIAVSGGVAALAVTLFLWWVVKTLQSSNERAMRAEQSDFEARAQLRSTQSSLDKMTEAYAKLNKRYLDLVPHAIAGATDEEAVVLSGGDPGPGSDELLQPDWSRDTPDGARVRSGTEPGVPVRPMVYLVRDGD